MKVGDRVRSGICKERSRTLKERTEGRDSGDDFSWDTTTVLRRSRRLTLSRGNPPCPPDGIGTRGEETDWSGAVGVPFTNVKRVVHYHDFLRQKDVIEWREETDRLGIPTGTVMTYLYPRGTTNVDHHTVNTRIQVESTVERELQGTVYLNRRTGEGRRYFRVTNGRLYLRCEVHALSTCELYLIRVNSTRLTFYVV